ncbi:MAG: hypothetical protein K6A93_09050 [Bacteroidaceae bacterium]|jgi:hypothetical protein|nr:hypothetical protein [Bacteroidaceae bacterium]
MKKIYLKPEIEVVRLNVCTQMCTASKEIKSSDDLILGAPGMPDFGNEDDLLDFNWQEGLPMF